MPLFYAPRASSRRLILESVVHSFFDLRRAARRALALLACGTAFFAAGCHNNNLASGYGEVWVTLTDSPGDFTSYIVNVDSVTLTRNDGAVVTALATVETVDFAKLNSVAELWGTATIPVGTYVSASITLDYTAANTTTSNNISVLVNGLPQRANVVDVNGAQITTKTINVILDPAHPLVIPATYATTSAQRLAFDFNLAASNTVNLSTSPATVTANPYLTASIAPPDNKMIRVRGPLINSSVTLGTFTVYVRPFYDEINSLGSLTLFTSPTTIYTLNGVASVGTPGLTQLSQSSAGSTETATYATYEPTATPTATAGIYHAKYVVGGSTLEDVYTQGLEGDVVARVGNVLQVRGATLQLNDGTSSYNVADAFVTIGPSTIVTVDDQTAFTGLNYNSVAVGQHVIVRGIYSLPNNVVNIDATGASSTNTGSVRLKSTHLWGSIISSTAGNLLLNLQTISDWPVADFAFAGNGATAASNPTAANFTVNTGAIVLPDTTAGDPVFVDGLVAPFGTAPPDFTATAVNSELSVQSVGAVAPSLTCGQGVLDCMPASLRVYFSAPGTSTPFTALSSTGLAINLADAHYVLGEIRIGAESIDLKGLPGSPQIVATAAPAPVTATATGTGSVPQTLPPVFLPEYSYGNPLTTVSESATVGINVFSAFSTFATDVTTALATTPALQVEARGTYNRSTNTFNAISVNVVL